LHVRATRTTSAAMITRRQWKRFIDRPLVEWGMLVLGVLLIIAGVLVAPLPGPGGIFFIVPGLALVLKTSMWAKRRYVRFKRWQPKAGHWMDWGLRRRSHRRREALRKVEVEPLDVSPTGPDI
jgi:hypothetical protein